MVLLVELKVAWLTSNDLSLVSMTMVLHFPVEQLKKLTPDSKAWRWLLTVATWRAAVVGLPVTGGDAGGVEPSTWGPSCIPTLEIVIIFLNKVAFTFGASSEFSLDSSGFLFAFIGFLPPEVFGRAVEVVVGDGSSSFNASEPITTGAI